MANRAIYRRAARDEDYAGMGTTLTALRIAPSGNRAYVAHVGDSRCYRLRPPTTMLLTRDHTRGALLGTVGPLAAQLSRAVGIEPSVEIDLHVFEVQAGDHYLLCSDGLTNNLDIETIGALALGDAPLAQRVRGLVDAANERGGKDNITVVLVSVVEHEG
jgi:protein phosphatase